MTDPQPDHKSHIQKVLTWESSPKTFHRECFGAADAWGGEFIPKSTIYDEFNQEGKVEDILEELYNQGQTHDAEYIRNHYLRGFIILICIGEGSMIKQFTEYVSLQDHQLPFRRVPEGFPSSTKSNIWDKFYQKQWKFCPINFEYNMSYQLSPHDVLPITLNEPLRGGGSATTHKIELHEDYNHLEPFWNDNAVGSNPWSSSF